MGIGNGLFNMDKRCTAAAIIWSLDSLAYNSMRCKMACEVHFDIKYKLSSLYIEASSGQP